jgi:hypothetical protein
MLIQSLFYGTIVGSIVGLVWAFGLNIKFSTIIPIGAIVGLIVGLAFVFFGKAARTGGNITTGETLFVSNAFLTFLGIASAAIGLLVWLARVVFF